MENWQNIALVYGAGSLLWTFFLGLIGNLKGFKNDIIRAVIWPLSLAATLGQLVRAIIRMVIL